MINNWANFLYKLRWRLHNYSCLFSDLWRKILTVTDNCWLSVLLHKCVKADRITNGKNIVCQGARNRYNRSSRGDNNPSIIHWLTIANDETNSVFSSGFETANWWIFRSSVDGELVESVARSSTYLFSELIEPCCKDGFKSHSRSW